MAALRANLNSWRRATGSRSLEPMRSRRPRLCSLRSRPAIYGYPADLAAAIAVDAVRAATTRVDEIIFVCFDEATLSIYRDLLA